MRILGPRGARGTAALALAVLVVSSPTPAAAQVTPPAHERGALGLGLALRRLPLDARLLYVTAHPDDEDGGVLVKYRRGLGARTALLTLTRGEGGQNEIGPELFEALGVLRSEELAAAHRLDGAQQFFTRAFEFGYSFSVEETFSKWGREPILEDVVRVVRAFRPDVVLTMELEGPGGGQHHQASAQLALEAFRAAADPARFSEQLTAGLRPWQPRKLLRTARPGEAGVIVIDTSTYDPLLGMTWNQLGSVARAAHRCQGMPQLVAPSGTGLARYLLVGGGPADAADLFSGIDTTLRRWLGLVEARGTDAVSLEAGIGAVEEAARLASAAYDVRSAHRALAPLRSGLSALRGLHRQAEQGAFAAAGRAELLQRLEEKEGDFLDALALAHELDFQVRVDRAELCPGQSFHVVAETWNQGPTELQIEAVSLRLPGGWEVSGAPGEPGSLAGGQGRRAEFQVTVPETARYSRPYWTRSPTSDRYEITVPEHHTLPWSPPEVVGVLRYSSGGVAAWIQRAAFHAYEGPWVGGQREELPAVVPELSVRLAPEVAIVPLSHAGTQREFRVRIRNSSEATAQATVRLEAPEGWRVEPESAPTRFQRRGEEVTARFFVTPPPDLLRGDFEVRAVATANGREFRDGYELISYDHIQPRRLFRPALSQVKALKVAVTPGNLIGYVMGAGDRVPQAIEQLGLPSRLLSPEDLAFSDLSEYTTIVTGIRAYQTRPELKAHHQRLLDYVRAGGHLVVQYNKQEFNQLAAEPTRDAPAASPPSSPFAPYPARVTTNRVTVEEAPVRILRPDHPLLSAPNRIGAQDFEGWVQERGLYFLGAQDPHYEELLACADPWPENPGEKLGLLVTARLGEGRWTYVGLGLWRQLPAGTRGAYRILANLLSRPRGGC